MVKDSEVVALKDIRQALQLALFNNKILCEGAAACSIAAAMNIARKVPTYKKIVCLLTGGNLPPSYLHPITL